MARKEYSSAIKTLIKNDTLCKKFCDDTLTTELILVIKDEDKVLARVCLWKHGARPPDYEPEKIFNGYYRPK